MVVWVVVLVAAAGARSPFGRRRGPTVHDETLIDFGTEPPVGVAGEALVAWSDDADVAGEPIELAEPPTPPVGDRPEPPAEAIVRAPLVIERPSAVDEDEPVDLAALVAEVDAADEPEGRS
jgi:hypothetical protein